MELLWKKIGTTRYVISNKGDVSNAKTGRILKPRLNNGVNTIVLRIDGESKQMCIHIIMAIVFLGFNHKDKSLCVRHIDGNLLNNRLDNLQIVSRRFINATNSKKRTSKYPGVCWCNTAGRWLATIKINNKMKYLGHHKREFDAHKAYVKALEELNNNKTQ